MMHITPMRDKLACNWRSGDGFWQICWTQQIRWVLVTLLVERAHSRVREIPRKTRGECVNIFRRLLAEASQLLLQLASMPVT